MRIKSFCVKNFRNLRLAECSDPPDFVVICGGNGCGKSALLEALITAKETAGAYGNFSFDPRAVSADADMAEISVKLTFSNREQQFIKDKFKEELSETDELVVKIHKDGRKESEKITRAARLLLSYYSKIDDALGFFDYFGAYRQRRKSHLSTWNANFLSDDRTKGTLAGEEKFNLTKEYLSSLKMRDLQELEKSLESGKPSPKDSLKEIREFFNSFFTPMEFKDVLIHKSPFDFVISTPVGDIDIDDLSSGEKEIMNIFIRFHQLNPKGAVILFDEADAHLHPDLERRYLAVLRKLGQGNQLFITTHSPEMMIEAGKDSLYTILKEPTKEGSNQFIRVTQTEHLHNVLSEMMGSRGIISFNQRIVFIEGENASADRAIYEAAYPPSKYNISFVPAGNSATVGKIAEQVNELLTSSLGFQEYYSIVDRDIERFESDPTGGRRLFKLPVYHIENLLINEGEILEVTRSMMGDKCPYNKKEEVTNDLKKLVLDEKHLLIYTRALIDAKLAKIAKDVIDLVYKQKKVSSAIPEFKYAEVEKEAKDILTAAIDKGIWYSECKGRDLLKAYCAKHGLKYEHFRNLLISRIDTPPEPLAEIMKSILGN